MAPPSKQQTLENKTPLRCPTVSKKRKQQQQQQNTTPCDTKKEIQSYCLALKKRLESELKIVEDFLNYSANVNNQDPPVSSVDQFIDFTQLDFGNFDGSDTVCT